MKPDDRQLSHGGGEPQSSDSTLPTNPAVRPAPPIRAPARNFSASAQQREAAANVIRGNIDRLYSGQPAAAEQPVAETENPYLRTHSDKPTTQEEQWKQYHTAWQNYYQKYYEAYYNHHLKKNQPAATATTDPTYFKESVQPEPEQEEIISKDEALYDLRSKLLSRVTESAKKVRKSRHFVPILAGVFIILAFAFIQYNKVLVGTVMAYVSPGNVDVQNIVIDPSAEVNVGPEPMLVIPKINVNVPVQYGVGNDYDSQMAAMENGVAHFAIPGASSRPGQIGNTVLSGHSSNDLFDGGDYKFIFAQLEKLKEGDTIYANYEGIRYTYVVTKMEVVKPTDVQKLVYDTDKPVMTLITCTPLGTSLNRLLVTAEQVSPDPSASAEKPTEVTSGEATELSGASAPSLFERMFGAN